MFSCLFGELLNEQLARLVPKADFAINDKFFCLLPLLVKSNLNELLCEKLCKPLFTEKLKSETMVSFSFVPVGHYL